MKAIWNETVVAESGQHVVVEGKHYFPPASIKTEYSRKSEAHTTCPWKGEASYYDIVVNGKVNKGAASYYPDPSDAANEIKGHVAFWRGVQVTGCSGILKPYTSQARFAHNLPFTFSAGNRLNSPLWA